MSIIWCLCIKLKFVKKILPKTSDNFCAKCIEWQQRIVILTLKNEKVYIGILWQYPENLNSKPESQSICIAPIQSGYRNKETKQVCWTTNYIQWSDEKLKSMRDQEINPLDVIVKTELIIPRSEILTFRKFSEEALEHFHKTKSPTNTHNAN